MSASPFKPPDVANPEPSPWPDPVGGPPIVLRDSRQPANGEIAPRGRFQFSLWSLLLFATGVSVLVSLVAWLGLVFFMVIMMLAGLIAVFVGVRLLDNRVILAGGILMFLAGALSPLMFIFAGL